ncbi:hypothetical protein DL89DRAFT_265051 [Linderina pennispora]|uniref:Secreted protein n=1 Tax=Linderina pennispora TaxID=61395 RepID=A0A1Y1WHP5_9FUNG|nr:uncharacterized protein DL89DRAFT_265051 [Linderina pennispora]ORX72858.1 hypothetical protein DL89DRAFT_265051 [Linderina pennispora]
MFLGTSPLCLRFFLATVNAWLQPFSGQGVGVHVCVPKIAQKGTGGILPGRSWPPRRLQRVKLAARVQAGRRRLLVGLHKFI